MRKITHAGEIFTISGLAGKYHKLIMPAYEDERANG
jgi:hypothetical protein